MKPKFSIVSVCKARLDHLQQSLPAMLAQAGSEVIVVDYDCPEKAADWVESHYPAVRTIRVPGEAGFSNWKARNAGAAVANGEFLLFCDADTVLADGATAQLAATLAPTMFGYFRNENPLHAARPNGLTGNDLKGFLAVTREAFNHLGGYDELLTGYASGADTDLENRLRFVGLEGVPLDISLIDGVISHGDEERLRFHADPVAKSFLTGKLHSALKLAVMWARRRASLHPMTVRQLHADSAKSASTFLESGQTTVLRIPLSSRYLQMLEMLGPPAPRMEMILEVRVVPGEEEEAA